MDNRRRTAGLMPQLGETGWGATPSTHLPLPFSSCFPLKMLEILYSFLHWDAQRVYFRTFNEFTQYKWVGCRSSSCAH